MPSAWGHTRLLETDWRLITQESHCFSCGSVNTVISWSFYHQRKSMASGPVPHCFMLKKVIRERFYFGIRVFSMMTAFSSCPSSMDKEAMRKTEEGSSVIHWNPCRI